MQRTEKEALNELMVLLIDSHKHALINSYEVICDQSWSVDVMHVLLD